MINNQTMFRRPSRYGVICLFYALIAAFVSTITACGGVMDSKKFAGTTLIVAASNSPDKARAGYVCDGIGDQEEINAAIKALPAGGGTVLLLDGTYDIRRGEKRKCMKGTNAVECPLGGIVIDRSDVCLKGEGWGAKLILAENQSINVIRVIGLGIGNIVIRDLYIDANRARNPRELIEGERFEGCGIKVASGLNSSPYPAIHDVTIDSCKVLNAAYLGIMPWGKNMIVSSNHVANADSDCIEVLGGPARVSNNVVINKEGDRSHVGIGTDACNDAIISNNKVICEGGHFDLAIRTWADTVRTTMDNNEVVCKSGSINSAWDIRGNLTTITGNTVSCIGGSIKGIKITGHTCAVSGNKFENCVEIMIQSDKPELGPVILKDNLLHNTIVKAVTDNVKMENNTIK